MNPRQGYAADGDLDTTFGVAGKVTSDFLTPEDSANAIAIQSDGKIVAGGQAGQPCNFIACRGPVFALARYNKDGSPDTTFGAAGKVTSEDWPEYITALAIQSDGKIVAAGQNETHLDPYYGILARYNSDGSLDAAFGVAGRAWSWSSVFYEAIAIQADGKIVGAGRVYIGGAVHGFALARHNSDGSLDATFGRNGIVTTEFTGYVHAYAWALVIQSDGKIVAAGAALTANHQSDFALARYNSDGSLDATFGLEGKTTTDLSPRDNASSVAIQSDGKIVAAEGIAENYSFRSWNSFSWRDFVDGDFALARYNNDGSLDDTFGIGGKVTTNVSASGLAIQSDGKIVVAGGGALVRYNGNGALDATFGLGGRASTDFQNNALAVQSDGKIVAAGTSGGDFALARYHSTSLLVTSLTFDPTVVRPGETLTAVFSGNDLTDETYFDIRFRSPGSSSDQFAPNWQQGASGRRTVATGTALGAWTVTGVRAHRDADDHAGDFVSLASTLTVTEVRLSLNSTRYCTGDTWDLRVASRAPNDWIDLSGTSGGAAWQIQAWRRTGSDGSLTATGTFVPGTEGAHTLRVRVGDWMSNIVSFTVSTCGP
jgi:uncharacterized delta-60 repeat protein